MQTALAGKQLMYYVVHAKSFLVLDHDYDGSCIDSIPSAWRVVISYPSTCLIYFVLVLDHSAHYGGVPKSAKRPAHADHRPRHVATRSDNVRAPKSSRGVLMASSIIFDYSEHPKHFHSPLC